MKIGPLPTELDLRSLAVRGAQVEGIVAEESLPRLRQAGIEMAGPVAAAFSFERDESGRYIVVAAIQATVLMICQRCLGPISLDLNARSNMACVWDDQEAVALPAGYEPLIVGQVANLREIAEEEILLAIPVSPLHAEDCGTSEQKAALESEPAAKKEVSDRDSPFAVLEKLKT
ncbi:MAG: YceD family protein [Luminiphilus sp.]|jgi:uncharacterized protein|nr:YceD family protein [Luminiphilus sp.]